MKIIRETETGSIVSFNYDNEIAEITGLTTSFEPSQDGTPWMSDIEQTPYLLRRSPDLDHDYNSEMDTLIGGSVAWNQLAPETYKSGGDTSWGSFYVTYNETGAYDSDTKTASMNVSVANSSSRLAFRTNNYQNHVHLVIGVAKSTISGTLCFECSRGWLQRTLVITANNSVSFAWIYKPDYGTDSYQRSQFSIQNNSAAYTLEITKPQMFDLTQMLGTEIADYVYSLEQTTAGSGIAWLKSHGFLTKDYYAYDTDSLVSVKTSEHKTVGKNLIEPIMATGTFRGVTCTNNGDGSFTLNGTATGGAATFRIDQSSYGAANNLKSYKAGQYTISGLQENVYLSLMQNQTWVSCFNVNDRPNGTYTVASDYDNCFIYLSVLSGATVNNVTVKPMLEKGSTATAYEPYESHSYPLDSDLELRGIPKLSNGNLYYDGDEYSPSGQVVRNYKKVTATDIKNYYNSFDASLHQYRVQFTGAFNGIPNNNQTVKNPTNAVCNIMDISASWSDMQSFDASVVRAGMYHYPQWDYTRLYIVLPTSITTKADAETWLDNSGIEITFKLQTPTTETADSFASPQIVSPLGTEEYVDERSVPVPVGHRTTYMLPYPISGWDEVKAYVSPTEEEEDATIYTINLNGTRYGGTIDFFRGVMNVAMAEVDLGTLTWGYSNTQFYTGGARPSPKIPSSTSVKANAICSIYPVVARNNAANGTFCIAGNGNFVIYDSRYTSASDFKIAMSGVKLVYELAEPIEVQLTAEQIEALNGQNNVWANCGDITLSWLHAPVLSEAVMLNGKYLEMAIDGYTTLGTSGRRSLGREIDAYTVGTADGETVKNSTFPSRKITVNYVIQTDTEEELTEAINQLANILNQDECDFVFRDEPDKYFSGYGLLDSEPKKYRHAVKGTWSLYCAYPFKRSTELVELSSKDPTVASVDAHSATFTFDYNGTLPAHPILRAEFASAKSGGEYNEDGDCGYVAFLDAEENIIQLGNPEVLDVDQYANETLINREFTSISGWTASGVTVGDITDQFWESGKGQTQSYAKGTGSLTKSVTGAVDMEFDIVHRLCVSAANQTGKFECYAKNGNNIVVGFKIEKTGNGTTGTVSYILNNKVVGTDSIDLSYYNTHFGYCNRTARYVTQTYSVKETYYVKKKGKKKKKTRWVTKTRQVQNGWNYTQSNLNSGWSKDGGVVVFSVGNLADRTFKSSDIELTPSTSVVFGFTGSFHTNAVHSCAMLSKAGVPFAEIPNVFTAGDVVEGDCNSADVMLYRAGSLEGHLEPQYGALGNDWEDFEIKPGKNIIRAVWSDWVNTSYKPEIKIIFNEVYV